MFKIILLLLTGYLLFAALVFVLQRKMIYYPGGATLSQDHAQYRGLQHWPSPDDFRGFLGVPNAAPTGTVIVFHGNAGTAADRDYYTGALARHGLRVILAEYPGYGGRRGQPSENALVRDGAETLALARQAFGDEPLFVLGESLGAGVASALAARYPDTIDGLILITPWDTLPAVAQTHYWYLPVGRLMLDRFDNIRNLSGHDGPVAVLLAELDEIVPTSHGRALYESIGGAAKRLWVFEGAGHNTWPTHADATWWREVVEHLRPRQLSAPSAE